MRLRIGLEIGTTLLIGLMVTAAVSGCGGDDADVSVGDFEGSWEATSFTITPADSPEFSLDAVAMGVTLEASVDDAGALTGVLEVPELLGGPATLDFGGEFVLEDQETLTLSFTPEIPPLLTSFSGPFTLSDDTLTITDENAVFDFGDGNGEVAVTAVVVVSRV